MDISKYIHARTHYTYLYLSKYVIYNYIKSYYAYLHACFQDKVNFDIIIWAFSMGYIIKK